MTKTRKRKRKSRGKVRDDRPEESESYIQDGESRSFGSYDCGCGRQWVSEHATKERSMACKHCGKDVLPKLGHLGEFQCLKCWHQWTSVKSKPGVSQECEDCGKETFPRIMNFLEESEHIARSQRKRKHKENQFFGGYDCICGKHWESERAVKGKTMKCNECGKHVLPEPKRRGQFGEYQCPSCGKRWMSVKSEPGVSQKCKKCGTEVKAQKMSLLHQPKFKCRRIYERSEEDVEKRELAHCSYKRKGDSRDDYRDDKA